MTAATATAKTDIAALAGKWARKVAMARILGLALFAAVAGVWSLQYYLRVAPTEPNAALSLVTPLGPFENDPPIRAASDWTDRRAPLLRAAFQTQVYGELPAPLPAAKTSARVIDANAFGGAGRIEEVSVSLPGPDGAIPIDVLLALPQSLEHRPAPVLIAPNFCGNGAALGFRYKTVSQPGWTAERCRSALGRLTTELMHGDSIIQLPVESLLKAGYAVVTFSPGQVVPDDSSLAEAAIARLPPSATGGPRVGAIGAWSWSMSRVTDLVLADARFDPDRVALFGHSRFGKAALLTAALDTRIRAVIANQSGRLGAAPSYDTVGEPLPSLFGRFPYWFPAEAKTSEETSQALDQQYLLALIAPRPLLLGGASLDRWSDPAGAFQSAQTASAAYRLFGGTGLDQASMKATNLNADVAYYFRSGGHGVRRSDWMTTIAFLKRQFGRNQASSATVSTR
jgi:hypothetical protein